MMPICMDRGDGGGTVKEAYLNWSSLNSTSVAVGLMVGDRGMLFIDFCLRKGGGWST
jgi:hypothetical protein